MAAALEEQRTQNAMHLREQMKAFHRELELELTIDREKNQLLLTKYQQDNTRLQQKVRSCVWSLVASWGFIDTKPSIHEANMCDLRLYKRRFDLNFI